MENVNNQETFEEVQEIDTVVNNEENGIIKTSVKKGAPIIIGVTSFIGGLIVRPLIDKSIKSFKKWRKEKQLQNEEVENSEKN